MAAKVWIGIKTRAEYLRRLSIVFAVELRLRIVTEVYMRGEMSPKQFYEEFGGRSLSRVTRNFERLEEHGWLSYIRSEGPGDGRRGGVEHFYRATELAIFDDDTWSLLPYSIRVAFSWTTFKQLSERFRYAMEAGSFDARPDRHHSCTPLLLDRLGWERVLAAIDALFVSLFEEMEDAKLRIRHSGEKAMVAAVSLVVFELPMPGDERVGPSLAEAKDSRIPFPLRLSKVLQDEICLGIVEETNQREMSVAQYHREFGGSIHQIRSRFKMLEKFGWLKRVSMKRRRGKEQFYRAAGPAKFDNNAGADVPDSIKQTRSWATFEQLSEQVKMAMEAGTFDARTDRYLAWSPLRLDHRGWEKLITAINSLHAFILEEADKAEVRLADSGEKPVMMTVGLAMFESPKDSAEELWKD